MTEQPQDLSSTASTRLGAQPAASSAGVDYTPASQGESLIERPEVRVAATFVGGLLAASILKRFAK